MIPLEEFSFPWDVDGVAPSSSCYRPPSWPPPGDWSVTLNRDGSVLSRYQDPVWDFSAWAGRSLKLNFEKVGGRTATLDRANADQLRLCATFLIWGTRTPLALRTVSTSFGNLRRLFVLCSVNGILASDLTTYPRVMDQIPQLLPASVYLDFVVLLEKLWAARDVLGFALLDPPAILEVRRSAPDHERTQTAYIPPRIWAYQVGRLRECMEDFLKHQAAIEKCFNFCIDAYSQMHGSLEAALTLDGPRGPTFKPFAEQTRGTNGARSGRKYYGRFDNIAKEFGIFELIERWIEAPPTDGKKGGFTISQFGAYLTLVQSAGVAYVLNFTLQRKSEALSLRADCLVFEEDVIGRIPVICGETTKTDADSDARWPTSPSVELATRAMSSVARLRIKCAAALPSAALEEHDRLNPFLFHRAFEPWGNSTKRALRYDVQPHLTSYRTLVSNHPRLFDLEQLRIREEDLKIALMFTLRDEERRDIVLGTIWPLGWHQLRRTAAVNMFASRLVSDSSIQFVMKHSTLAMGQYYGRGHGRLRINSEAAGIAISAMYEAMAQQAMLTKTDRFRSPLGEERKSAVVVNLVGTRDAKALAKAFRDGKLSFREVRVGACTKQGDCQYGGIESVARCAGSDGGGPCADALFDREKAPGIEGQLASIKLSIKSALPESPRWRALNAERQALENFLNAIRQ